MKFSVLLSVYNKENPEYLKESLESVFSQTLLPSEVVLIKDGPLTDELNKVIDLYTKYYSYLKVFSLADNQGLGKALNEGLKHCSFDIVVRMDTDDIAKPKRFEKQLAVLKMYQDVDVVRKLPEFHNAIQKFAKYRNPINHPVAAFRKSAVLSVGSYRHFPLFEDYYLWVRMLMNGAKFYNIQESLLYFRFSSKVFKRRGGWKYAINEFRFQKMLRQLHFISFPQYIRNIFVRFLTRIIPNSLRKFVYKTILR